jgi:hypothetical protein
VIWSSPLLIAKDIPFAGKVTKVQSRSVQQVRQQVLVATWQALFCKRAALVLTPGISVIEVLEVPRIANELSSFIARPSNPLGRPLRHPLLYLYRAWAN